LIDEIRMPGLLCPKGVEMTAVGVVLAGGRSTRMGRDKALLPWRGVSLLEHMCRLLQAAGLDRVLVSGERPGYESVPDAHPGRGPGIALADVLASLDADAWALVVPVDMPLLHVELLRGLMGPRPAHYSGHPLPAWLPARIGIRRAPDGESIRALHAAAGSVALPIAPEAAAFFVNANTDEEWRQLQGSQA
jgi:molybdopterin-guanine dinucleotide biosynthesis protein A